MAHRDRRSILALDRPAIRWRAGLSRGVAWSEAPDQAKPAISSWRDAACELAACGLVVEPRRRYLHSSVSGVAPVYHVDHEDATYFASRIDPLVAALPRRFTADWRAWASILSMRSPVGTRTPFREVSRLRPFATLVRGRRRAIVEEGRWPWAEVEPSLDLDDGSAAVAEAMRAALRPLEAPVNCLLSGGWDSRLLLCLLAEQLGPGVRAFTVGLDVGNNYEEELAAAVARELGVDHTLIPSGEDRYWEDVVERLVRCDFQYASFPWMMPIGRGLRSEPGPVLDGLAFDTLAMPGRYYPPRSIEPDGSVAGTRALWRSLGRKLGTHRAPMLSPALGDAVLKLSKRQFLRESKPFRGHPNETLLTFYRSRTLRAVSLMPHAVMGTDLAMLTPFVDDRVARACLAILPAAKYGGHLYRALFALINPEVGRLPSMNDPREPIPTTGPRRRDSPAAVAAMEAVLREGPLSPHLDGELAEHLAAGTLGQGLRNRSVQRAAITVATMHLWAERYGSRLADPDPAELLELTGG